MSELNSTTSKCSFPAIRRRETAQGKTAVCEKGWLRPETIKLFSCSSQLSMKFILLINVKMPTIVGFLTFIRRINTTSESSEVKKIIIYQHFSFCEALIFHA